MRLLLITATLVTLFSAPRQSQSPFRPNPDKVPEPEWRITEEFQVLLAKMQGCWQLTEYFSPMSETTGRQEVAFLTVSQEFASIEFHLGFFTESRESTQLVESYFQTGTFRLSTDDRGLIVMTTLIGSAFDEYEQVVWEPPGIRRAFVAKVQGEQLVLTRQIDATRYVFERVRSLLERDFYGRVIERDGGVLDADVRKRPTRKPRDKAGKPEDDGD